MKQCGTCGALKAAAAFGRDSRSSDGLRFRCRQCRKSCESKPTDVWAHVDTSQGALGCWPWTGARDKGGYGLAVDSAGKIRRAHRVVWELMSSTPIVGLDLCHHCDNPCCVNPLHLFAGTESDNMRDMVLKGRHSQAKKTHCPSGHAYDAENTSTSRGYRRCKQCDRDYMARRRALGLSL